MLDVQHSYLITRAGAFRCALPLSHVREVMRILPVKTVMGANSAVLGAAVVRGAALPVVSLPAMLGQTSGNESRFVVLRTAERDCVLAVDAVEHISALDDGAFEPLPKLLQGIDAAEAVAALDRELILTLSIAWVAAILPPGQEASV